MTSVLHKISIMGVAEPPSSPLVSVPMQVEALPASDVRCGAAWPRELRRMGREESRLGWQMVSGRGSIWAHGA
jgi:hypothetical protein